MADQPTANTRARAPRKNLLLAATIEAGALKAPVRIRNLSEGGAMLEGAVLPDIGTAFMLRRLDIEIGGTVIWRESGRCGVEFDGPVEVLDGLQDVAVGVGLATAGDLTGRVSASFITGHRS